MFYFIFSAFSLITIILFLFYTNSALVDISGYYIWIPLSCHFFLLAVFYPALHLLRLYTSPVTTALFSSDGYSAAVDPLSFYIFNWLLSPFSYISHFVL